jgi:hypothetical protein
MSKKCNICKHTKKFDVTSGMPILQGHIPLKHGVVPFYTLPLVATSKQSHVRGLVHTGKMKNIVFLVVAHKTRIAKVVGNGDMHNPTKYGPIFESFPFQKPNVQNPSTFSSNPINLIRGSSFL